MIYAKCSDNGAKIFSLFNKKKLKFCVDTRLRWIDSLYRSNDKFEQIIGLSINCFSYPKSTFECDLASKYHKPRLFDLSFIFIYLVNKKIKIYSEKIGAKLTKLMKN
ncbi:hypothetical protein BpHYR1_025034 [Brachionus plicatilis]|uniref:Uncharacterized protein n=1 Tax=Brachionus plicatilis TaxID=10195 RepID=A0A3M7RP43_BRAPC|nr:hypothetical protein BpHYR1_025034 [Brachionus plicatilis]